MVATHTDSRTISDKLLDAGGISVDRLPMLHVVFDRMATHCADSLRQMSASPAYFSLSQYRKRSHRRRPGGLRGNAIAAVFHAPEWDSRILVGFDRDFIFSMVEVLFGADGAEPPIDEERPFSNIEINIAQAIFERIAKVLQVSFGSLSESAFKFERIETRMDFAIIGRRNNLSVVAKFLLQALEPRRRDVHHHPAIGAQPGSRDALARDVRRCLAARSALGAPDPERDPAYRDAGLAPSSKSV